MAADNLKLGKKLAKEIVNIVKNKKKVEDTPIILDNDPKMYINLSAMKKYNIKIPVKILKIAEKIE